MPKAIPKAKVEAIIELYESGVSYAEIQAQTGVSKGTISRYLRKREIPKSRIRYYSDETKKEVLSLFEAGCICKEIAKRIGIPLSSVYRILDDHPGMEAMRKRHAERQSEIIKRYKAGQTTYRIAKEMGLHFGHPDSILRRMGLIGTRQKVKREAGLTEVDVLAGDSVQSLRSQGLTIDQIAEITKMTRVDVFQELQS